LTAPTVVGSRDWFGHIVISQIDYGKLQPAGTASHQVRLEEHPVCGMRPFFNPNGIASFSPGLAAERTSRVSEAETDGFANDLRRGAHHHFGKGENQLAGVLRKIPPLFLAAVWSRNASMLPSRNALNSGDSPGTLQRRPFVRITS